VGSADQRAHKANFLRSRIIDESEDVAIKRLGTTFLNRVEFDHMFGSTSGPWGGIGGAAMTNFRIVAFYTEAGMAVLFMAPGVVWKVVKDFRIQANWK
jgi:hypothetical protein